MKSIGPDDEHVPLCFVPFMTPSSRSLKTSDTPLIAVVKSSVWICQSEGGYCVMMFSIYLNYIMPPTGRRAVGPDHGVRCSVRRTQAAREMVVKSIHLSRFISSILPPELCRSNNVVGRKVRAICVFVSSVFYTFYITHSSLEIKQFWKLNMSRQR